ncbi:putative GTP-binding protein 6 isoform X3 [Neofelis nebulosa]|uniref:putative GTP-binding protein 6 isoform X3 n=1 Tax=Neofelis nebulosa TaxID=61452 RepID=UPI00272D873E|nr:putative GTP-binding protein 6 isoform X3 [Neofelis nebulosa]
MWALRVAIRPAAWLSRVVLGRRAPRPAPPLLVCPERAFAAFDPGDLKGRGGGGRGPPADGPRSRTGEVEEPEDAEDEEEEEEELLSRDPLLPVGTQRVCLVHPEVKWGPGKPQLTRADRQVAEAESLVHTLDRWSVVERVVVPARTPDGKVTFGRGTLRHLTEKIRALPEITAVFLNVERMAPPTKKELEAAWGVQVFDRFTVVLSIFRCNARTKEARLQVALAELPLLRSHLSSTTRLDGRGGGSRYIMGSGESLTQVQRRLLKDKELKIRKALDRLREKRRLLGRQRRRREFPVVSMVGYTNCARGPSAPQDLVVHVRDVSHPETELQKATVLAALRGLRLPAPLLDSVLEVHNKVDLVPGYSPSGSQAVAVSALLGHGLPELRARLEDAVLRATGRQVLTLRVRLAGAQLSWLHQEATVQDVDVIPEAGAADVRVVISSSAYSKFRKLFPESASQ